jgi:hypothetical protein
LRRLRGEVKVLEEEREIEVSRSGITPGRDGRWGLALKDALQMALAHRRPALG